MRTILLLVLMTVISTLVFAQAPPTSDALKEADKISGEVVALFSQSKYKEALPLAQKAVSIRERELGKNHLTVASAWRNLAYVQLNLEKRKEAEKSFNNAFDIYEKNQPLSAKDEKVFAELLESVAIYEAINSDINGAEKKFLRAVELREKINGQESPETANSLLKLGQIYQLKGDFEKAAPVLLRALDIKTKKTGQVDIQADEYYSNAFCTLSKLNREDEKTKLREKFYPKKADVGKDEDRAIKGGVLNGKAIDLAKPAYPYEARQNRARGAVSVQVLIDETGKIIFACAVSGAKELQRSSEIAAYQSKFSPTTLGGQPVKVSGIITYNYVP